MKPIRKITAFVLACVLLLTMCAVTALAADKTVKLLCYNVAGLPSISGLMGMENTDVPGNQRQLGNLLNAETYDIIAVQEDFGYHRLLSAGLTHYPYQTVHSGGIPGGDGMNIFSKFPLYNTRRVPWQMASGVFNDGDELTPKGILYALLDLGDGIYADLYVIHADAFGDDASVAARNDNFRQLAAMINAKKSNRPVIITGDFNTSSHLSDGKAFTDYMITNAGFTDAWTKLKNSGDYQNYSTFGNQAYWGVWDSVEKVLYRDGKGVTVNVTDFSYLDFKNADGASISDHKAASATLTFTKTPAFTETIECLRLPHADYHNSLLVKSYIIVKDLYKVLLHIDDLIALIQ